MTQFLNNDNERRELKRKPTEELICPDVKQMKKMPKNSLKKDESPSNLKY